MWISQRTFFNWFTCCVMVAHHRKGGNSEDRIKETYQDIKVNGAVLIKGKYSRTDPPAIDNAADSSAPRPLPKVTQLITRPFSAVWFIDYIVLLAIIQCLKRRIYKLADPSHPSSSLNLVHYRECPEKEPVEKHSLQPQVFDCFNQFYARYLKFQSDAASHKSREQQAPPASYQQVKTEHSAGGGAAAYPIFQPQNQHSQPQQYNQQQTQQQNQNPAAMSGGFYHPGSFHSPMASSTSSNHLPLGSSSGFISNAHSTSGSTISGSVFPSCTVPAVTQQHGDDLDLLDSEVPCATITLG